MKKGIMNIPSVDKLYSNWKKIVAPYKEPSTVKSIYQIFSTLVPLFVSCYLSYLSLTLGPVLGTLPYLFFSLVGGALLVRVFIIMHDCGHGSFFKNKRANQLVGGILGVLVFTPSTQWSKEHAKHHATTGNLTRRGAGDVYMLTVKEYQASPWWIKLGYRIYRSPWFLFTLGAWIHFLIKQRAPYDLPLSAKKSWKSVWYTNAGIILTIAAFSTIFSFKTVMIVYLPMMLVGASLGTWIFYMQHQFEDTYWEKDEGWDHAKASIEGSSFYDLPLILHWFFGNIGYHHIHHLCSKIPNYNLPKCFKENDVFKNVTYLTLRESLRCGRLALWDETKKKMVAFKEIKPAT